MGKAAVLLESVNPLGLAAVDFEVVLGHVRQEVVGVCELSENFLAFRRGLHLSRYQQRG